MASRSYAKRIADLQSADYRFHLVYLWLESAELAVERVRARVRAGGHDIPEVTIKRRYERGRHNFINLYQPLADSWQVFNVSTLAPRIIAFGDKINEQTIENQILWKQIKR